jgi:glycosyltransferase involved in cell wall biosynthesis
MAASNARWIVLAEGRNERWGGELRRQRIFGELAARTGARVVDQGWYPVLLRKAVRGRAGWLPGPLLYRLPHRGPKPKLASAEKLRPRLLDTALDITDPVAVAIYDDAIAQARALGVTLERSHQRDLAERQRRNVDAFRWLVVPTRSFAELASLPMDRVIVGGNGTDVQRVKPGPWPEVPAIGMASGAAPGRGIESLIEAVRTARSEIPDLVLKLWLVATSDESEAYLDRLKRASHEPWIQIGSATYDELGDELSSASALAIPHPGNAYMDVALPVKLFDTLAAGRPLVVTPRTETRAIVERLDVGVVTADDGPDAIAASIVSLLGDRHRLEAMGARARQAAVEEFDWRIVGDRIAREILVREGEVDEVEPRGPQAA